MQLEGLFKFNFSIDPEHPHENLEAGGRGGAGSARAGAAGAGAGSVKAKYRGKWRNDLQDGLGEEHVAAGRVNGIPGCTEVYKGQCKAGRKHGKGRLQLQKRQGGGGGGGDDGKDGSSAGNVRGQTNAVRERDAMQAKRANELKSLTRELVLTSQQAVELTTVHFFSHVLRLEAASMPDS